MTDAAPEAITDAQKKRIVSAFLVRCLAYADAKLDAYRAQVPATTGMDALALQDRISHWTAYRAFTEYTIAEIGTTELDDWFAAIEP